MADILDQIPGTADAIRGQIIPLADGKIKAPKNIIQTVIGARALYYKFRAEHLKRIQLCARIEGLIAGNPPYDPIELAKHKLGHISNFNNLDGRSLYERSCLAYWNLLNETENLVQISLRGKDPALVEYAEIMAANLDRVIRSWPGFYTQMNTLSGQLVRIGVSPVIWTDEQDWRWKTVEYQRFFITDQALSDIEQMTAICIETPFTAQYLYEVYDEYKDHPEDTEWDLEELGKLLLFRANSNVKTTWQIIDMMDIQRRLQNGDITFDALFSDQLRLISLLYKEYDGKISHYMFERTYDHGNFLFFADRQYQNIQEAAVIFTASPGEFTIHSNRGVGHKIYAGCQAMMQLDCSIVDAARWGSTPLIKSLATGSKDFEAIRFYPGSPTNIGSAEFVENTIGANISQLIGASQYILQKLEYNTANSGDNPAQPDASQGSLSAPEARMQSYKEFNVLKNNVAHFYSLMDVVYRNMVIKMLHSKETYSGYEYAKEWIDSCIEDGVPKELFALRGAKSHQLPRIFRNIKASRVAGDGSNVGRIMGLQELGPIAPSFGAKAAKAYKREWILATMGRDFLPVFTADSDDVDEVSGGASLAQVENIGMKFGESPLFSLDNEHRAHFVTHLALGKDTIDRIQQQQLSPVEADKIFTVLLPHMEEHFKVLAQGFLNQSFVAQVKNNWNQLQKYAILNRKNAESQLEAEIKKKQEAEQNQAKVMNAQELEDYKVKRAEARADFKVQSQVARADKANQTRGDVMREKVIQDADIKRMEVGLDHQVKTLEAQKQEVEQTPLPELRAQLDDMTGATIAPSDIEKYNAK